MHEAKVREYWQRLWAEGDVSFAHRFYAPRFLADGVERTPEQFAVAAAAFRSRFEGMVVTVERVFPIEDGIVTRVRYRACYAGGYPGVTALGADIDITGLDVFRFEDDLVVEHLHEADHEALWEQLGVRLPPGA